MNPAQNFLSQVAERWALAFEQSAMKQAVHPVIVEKEFWVCWLLGVLFAIPELRSQLVFKGGTSLSKVFGIIDRFSEDVDVSVLPVFVGAEPRLLDQGVSRTRRDKAMAEMQHLCATKVEHTIMPLLEVAIQNALARPAQTGCWLSYELDAQSRSPVLLFNYPAIASGDLPYVRRSVKLELGSLTDQQPIGTHRVKPWVAEDFPGVFQDWQCEVTALELPRTFWEKATILHAEYYRPLEQSVPDRYARHYADFACLLVHRDAETLMADRALAERVVEWKNRLFSRSWARYDLARHGSFRLVPTPSRRRALEQDYDKMRPLFLHKPPAFSEVIDRLAAAEQKMNALRGVAS